MDSIVVEAAKGGDRRRDRSPPRERRQGLHRYALGLNCFYESPFPNTQCKSLTVLGLPPRTSWQDLKDLMRKAGEVSFTDVNRDGDGWVYFFVTT